MRHRRCGFPCTIDIGVVGAGIVGLATAYALTERGAPVRVYECGVPGNGQSGGESRIFRHAHDGPRLVAFARDGRAIWDEWADRLASELVSDDGAVAIGPAAELTFEVRGEVTRLSCLQDSRGQFGETGTYAAAAPGNRRYAVGLSESTPAKDDGSFTNPAGLAALADRAEAYVRQALPGFDPRPVDCRYCWVTTLPWSDDGFAVWEQAGVFVVAGHNLFKQAPALGRALAQLALGEQPGIDLRPEATLGRPQ